MPTAQFIHNGNAIDYTPTTNVSAGDVIVLGDLVCIAKLDIPANTLGALAVVGVFDIAKATGASTAIAAWATCYWNATTKQVTTVATGNKLMGTCLQAAGDTADTVRIRLNQ